MNMAMGPCLAWPRSHSNVRGWHVRMLDFQGSPPPQSSRTSTLVFHSPSMGPLDSPNQHVCWSCWIPPLGAQVASMQTSPQQKIEGKKKKKRRRIHV